jgi:hypothetical protein
MGLECDINLPFRAVLESRRATGKARRVSLTSLSMTSFRRHAPVAGGQKEGRLSR